MALFAGGDAIDSDEGSPPVSVAGGSATDGALPPITLPAPLGDTPRTRPVQAVWVIDGTALGEEAVTAALGEEAEAAAAHLAQWAALGDGLGVRPGPPRRLLAEADRLVDLAGRPSPWPTPLSTTLTAVEDDLAVHPADHTVVVAITSAGTELTDQPPHPRWSPERDTGPPDPGEPATHNRYHLRLQAGAGRPEALERADPLPGEMTIDPLDRSQLAETLARTFVDTYGGRWPDP